MRVLVAEDNAVMRRLLESALRRWEYEVISTADGLEAWQILSSADPPPIAVMDWMMPGLSGVELCRRLRARSEPPYVYAVLLTGRSDRADVVEGLEAGADDYVVKPFDMEELRVRLRAARRIVELERRLLEAQEQLRQAALRDPLTGLWNHGAILEMAGRELARARRSGEPVGLLMIDLDGFKRCNDGRGHQAGDAVLVELARRLTQAVRAGDHLGRYGGDEFLLVAPGCGGRELDGLAQRIREAVEAEPFHRGADEVRLTVSIGVAEVAAGSGEDVGDLIAAADEALYEAKRAGRNRVCFSAAAFGRVGQLV